jgi:hypothetical protein
MNMDQLKQLISEVKHEDYEFVLSSINCVDGARPVLQVQHVGPDNTNPGETIIWRGRKWLLSSWMTPSEVVQTCLKACLTANEHECRERFTYRGVTLFDPHVDLDKLVEQRIAAGLSERP